MVWIGYFDNTYQVSEEGQIRHRRSKRVLKPYLNKTGWHSVSIYGQKVNVCRIVALTLLPRIVCQKHKVLHLNGDKLDNRPCNLQWTSQSQLQRKGSSRKNIFIKKAKRGEHIYHYYAVRFQKGDKDIYYKQFKTLAEAEKARDAFKSSEEFRMSL